MKNKLIAITLMALPLIGISQNSKQIDSTAIFILDQMSHVIGDLESVTFKLNTSVDKINDDNNIEKHYSKSTVSMAGPNKLSARIKGDRGHHGYWYDGEYMTYYSFDENNYVTLEAPDNIIGMIDNMHLRFDFKFPAADFFYPSFTDDIIDDFDNIYFLGKRRVENTECYYIMATNDDMSVQIWIENGMYFLPKKMVIIYKNNRNLQYESTFQEWILNPNIPLASFEFLPPPNSKLIDILEN